MRRARPKGTDPLSRPCPHCGARIGQRCARPSGMEAGEVHAERRQPGDVPGQESLFPRHNLRVISPDDAPAELGRAYALRTLDDQGGADPWRLLVWLAWGCCLGTVGWTIGAVAGALVGAGVIA